MDFKEICSTNFYPSPHSPHHSPIKSTLHLLGTMKNMEGTKWAMDVRSFAKEITSNFAIIF